MGFGHFVAKELNIDTLRTAISLREDGYIRSSVI